MERLKAEGEIKVDRAKYQDYSIKDARIHYQFAKGVMKVNPLGLKFSAEGSFTAEGVFNGTVQFAAGETSGIQKTLKGIGVAKLGKGAIRESEIFDAIANLTGVPSLKNPSFDDGLFNLSIKDENALMDGWISSPLFKVSSRGMVDFEKRLDMRTEVKLSPSLTGIMKGRLAALKFLADEEGWMIIPLKIKGTTDKPSVNYDKEALGEQLGRGLTKEIERRLLERKHKESERPPDETNP